MEDTSHDLSPREQDADITHSCSQTPSTLQTNHSKHPYRYWSIVTFGCIGFGPMCVTQHNTTRKARTDGCTSIFITAALVLVSEIIPWRQSGNVGKQRPTILRNNVMHADVMNIIAHVFAHSNVATYRSKWSRSSNTFLDWAGFPQSYPGISRSRWISVKVVRA